MVGLCFAFDPDVTTFFRVSLISSPGDPYFWCPISGFDHKTSSETKIGCFRKAYIHKLSNIIDIFDWSDRLACVNINIGLEKFFNTLNIFFNAIFPSKSLSTSKNLSAQGTKRT